MKTPLKIILFLILVPYTVYQILNTPVAYAFTMKNLLFILQLGNFYSFSGNAANTNYNISETGGQLGAGLYTGTNYKVRAGFQYIRSIIPFSFTISTTDILFGTLDANTPLDRASTLTVNNSSAHGFLVTASEDHQISIPSSSTFIPDTACDSGPCTTTTSAPWIINGGTSTTFGFGYNCIDISGTTCPSDFLDKTYFRPFPILPLAVPVMIGTKSGRNFKAQITYRVNISGAQAPGIYSNAVTYIATPTF